MGSIENPQHSFTAPPESATFDGLLFDMDGTIIESTPAVIKHWTAIGNEIGVQPEVILEEVQATSFDFWSVHLTTSHGRRTIDVLKILSPEKANWEYVQYMEGLLPEKYGDDAEEVPGARALLQDLISNNSPWAIVTSGSTPLVTGWLRVLGLPQPEHLVSAESVAHGKPDPACYRLGREKLGLAGDDKQILVLEDAPAGIKAGKAAGCKVVGLVTSHTVDQVLAAEPDWIIKDLSSLKFVSAEGGKVTLEFRDALVKP
ncbi:glycerol-3-phosphate phosphatase [Podospora australis]|uniref:Glycerol-3-phosphate phosphatase n=1 Tax=Podospora australis TaxID=1536484 RepID=A0AAN6WY42_9PEZI|nr:glycerol-3-phosphate phosphatase [Podospora australis]